ncbi:MAG: FAD-binding protein [Deltaproteobacteria bacterium]|nr:FAD-binding protein [Deltaproteobacteria bacterium]
MDIVGEENFTDALIDLVSFSSDASKFQHRPDGAVWPQNTDQVASIMKLATEYGLPVTPRGAGTSLTGTAVPQRGGIVLDMSRMNKILKIAIEDRLVIVQPGVVFDDLQKALDPYGFFFPPDPASGKVSTLGGNVGTNAGGLKGAKYGVTKDYVLGLEVVMADGSILRTGSKCMKSVSGYDFTRLFVGSEGTLGVITEITLKINPKPLSIQTCTAWFEEIKQAGMAVSEIMRSGIIPSALEFVDGNCLKAVNQATDLDLPEVGAMLFVETDGYTKEETNYQMAKAIECIKRHNGKNITKATSPEEAEKLWTARKAAYGVLARLNNTIIVEDVTVPISTIPDILTKIQDISDRHNVLIPTLGHLGDGNFHPCIVYDGTDADETARVEQAIGEIFKVAIEMDGTLTGEHGIGLDKAIFMPLEHDEIAMKLMSRLKTLFDPNNILNPGKMGLEV